MSSKNRLTPDEMECLLHGISAEVAANGRPESLPPMVASLERPQVPSRDTSADASQSQEQVTPAGSENAPNAQVLHKASNENVSGCIQSEATCRTGFDGDQLREFQSIHEVFADLLAGALGDKLRAKIDVRVTEVRPRTFGEFVFGLDNPTCFVTLDLTPFSGQHCIEIQPTVLFPIIDRLLGGGKHAGPIVRRPLTEIETRLLRRISSIMFEQLRNAWRKYAAIKPVIYAIESNPKLSRCAPPGAEVYVVELEVGLPFARGAVRLAYLANALTAVAEHLAGLHDEPLRGDDHSDQETSEVRILIGEQEVDTPAESLQICIGDVISTGVPCSQSAKIGIDGQIRYRGRLGQHEGRKAILIVEETNDHEAPRLPRAG